MVTSKVQGLDGVYPKNIQLQDEQIRAAVEEGVVLRKVFDKRAKAMQHPTTEELNARCPKFKFALQEGLDSSFLPTPATNVATGWDVKSAKDIILKPNEYAMIPLGLRVISPEGWWLKLNPRSSTFAKRHLHTLYGVIDQDYRGMIYLAVQYCPKENLDGYLEIKFGDTTAQLIPMRLIEMKVEQITNEEFDNFEKTSRDEGGFGSSTMKEFK